MKKRGVSGFLKCMILGELGLQKLLALSHTIRNNSSTQGCLSNPSCVSHEAVMAACHSLLMSWLACLMTTNCFWMLEATINFAVQQRKALISREHCWKLNATTYLTKSTQYQIDFCIQHSGIYLLIAAEIRAARHKRALLFMWHYVDNIQLRDIFLTFFYLTYCGYPQRTFHCPHWPPRWCYPQCYYHCLSHWHCHCHWCPH